VNAKAYNELIADATVPENGCDTPEMLPLVAVMESSMFEVEARSE
jgi:hypothetical protein